MLTKVTIKEGSGWFLWKPKDDTTEPVAIQPGDYYQVAGSIKKAYRDSFKNRMAPLAATSPSGNFAWLLPYEKWVKGVYDGQLEANIFGLVTDCADNRRELADKFGLSPVTVDSLRNWQRMFLYDYLYALESGHKDYRRAAIVRVGGGKTLLGLALAQHHDRPLVLAPSYCWDSWRSEAVKWGLKCPRLSTYQSAHKVDDADCLILDEALIAANPNTKVHGDALSISRQARTVVGLTGTPQSTTPMDLRWLRAVYPGCVPGDEKPWRFLFGTDTELVEVRAGQKAYVTKNWNQEAVAKFVEPYVMVVKPQEILAELPEVTYQRITVAQPKQYGLILKGAATEKGKSKALAQARMCTDGAITDDAGNILAQLNTDKLDAIAEFVRNAGEPCVIFARWSYMVDQLAERFGPCSVLHGGSNHETEVSKFRNGETNVLVAQSDLCQGMNLQERARIVIFASNSLKPTNREQAIGRVWRPGQRRGVVVVDVVAEGTLDEVALRLLGQHKDRSEAYIESALKREFLKQVRSVV
jgi:hypothetical protein